MLAAMAATSNPRRSGRRSRLPPGLRPPWWSARQASGPWPRRLELTCWRVNMPPQLPAPGGRRSSRSLAVRPHRMPATGELAQLPQKALTTVRSQGPSLPGLERAAVDKIAGDVHAGHGEHGAGHVFLSQPADRQQPVMLWGVQAVRSNRRSPRATQRIFLPSVAHRDASS